MASDRSHIDAEQIEVDHRRGVIYVHDKKGKTVMRVSGCGELPPGKPAFIDIHEPDRTSIIPE